MDNININSVTSTWTSMNSDVPFFFKRQFKFFDCDLILTIFYFQDDNLINCLVIEEGEEINFMFLTVVQKFDWILMIHCPRIFNSHRTDICHCVRIFKLYFLYLNFIHNDIEL